MKKINLLVLLLCAALVLFSCEPVEGSDESSLLSGGSGSSENVVKGKKQSILKFSTSAAKALAVVDDEDSNRSAARNVVTDGMIMKILEDGSMESFFTPPEGVSMSPISYITQSPAEDAEEVYIVFNYSTWGWDSINQKQFEIGQLLCVFEDGTYVDLLTDEESDTYKSLYNASSRDSITFDDVGGMYYIVQESSGNSWTNVVYKYDPKSNTSMQLTPSIENTYYEKIQVSGDGKWLFAKASNYSQNSSKSYLRAIPVDNPENYINLFYSSNNGSWMRDWVYDSETKTVYYTENNTLYAIPEKDGTYNMDNLVSVFTGTNSGGSSWFSYWNLLDSEYNSSNAQTWYWRGKASACDPHDNFNYKTYYFRDPLTDKHELILQNIVDYFFAKSYESFACYEYVYNDETEENERYYYFENENGEKVYYNADDYEIRFDTFADIDGLKVLASETKDENGNYLSDLDLFTVLTEKKLLSKLGSLFDSRYISDSFFSYYDYNFYADVLYNKTDGTKIDERFFRRNEDNPEKYDVCGIDRWSIMDYSYDNNSGYTYSWNNDYIKEVTVATSNGSEKVKQTDAEAILKEFADCCGLSSIDFRLTAFKDDPDYGGLYTELTNEDAITFLDNQDKLTLFVKFCEDNYSSNYGHAAFLEKTCFKVGTNETAYVRTSNSSSSIYWGNVENLATSYGKSLYGLYYTWDNNNNQLYQLVEILNKDGEKTGTVVDSISHYNPITILSAGDGFCFENKLLNSQNKETGYQDMYYYDVERDECIYLFENVENNDSSEILSFTMGGDYVYCSLAKGFDVTNVKININTLDATTLSTNQKLTSIIVVK